MSTHKHINLQVNAKPYKSDAKTSQLYEVNLLGEKYLLKDHVRESLHNNTLQLNKRENREPLVRKEYEALKILAPKTHPQLVNIINKPTNKFKTRKAILMRKLPSNSFLTSNPAKSQTLSKNLIKSLANHIWQFHKKASRNMKISSGKINPVKFYRNLFLNEFKILEPLENSKFLLNKQEIIFDLIDDNKKILKTRSKKNCFIEGHGDLTVRHISIVNADTKPNINIIDIAPKKQWRLGDRRIDAAFLYIDLIINGYPDEAEEFWRNYSELEKSSANSSQKETDIIDRLGLLYRWIIVYRFAILDNKTKNLVKAQKALRDLL